MQTTAPTIEVTGHQIDAAGRATYAVTITEDRTGTTAGQVTYSPMAPFPVLDNLMSTTMPLTPGNRLHQPVEAAVAAYRQANGL